MALDFLPFEEGDRLTPDVLNELVGAIISGSIFSESASNLVADTMGHVNVRLSTLEAQVAALEANQSRHSIREQFVLTLHQPSLTLSKTPLLDSELFYINGTCLSKTGVPAGFVGDYSLAERVITFNTELANQIPANAVLVAKYDYAI